MNHQHLIDNAIFDTTIAGDAAIPDRQAEIDAFVRKDLMQIVDEVFDQVAGISGDAEPVLRLGKLDLDLGEIPYLEFRQQMPRKLREQLLLALGDMRHPPRSDAKTQHGLVDRKSAVLEQLFYFLRYGYLPWYSRLDGADALEALLIEAIDSAPAKLVELLRDNEHRAVAFERLQQQFPEPIVKRVLHIPSSQKNPADSHTEQIEQMLAQLVAALQSGDIALIGVSWQVLYDGHAGLLEKTLRYYGQRASVRRRIIAGLSAAQFDDLLRLFEPSAYEQVKAVLDPDENFERKGMHGAAERLRLQAGLREYVLGYLLVERGHQFDEQSFIGSLLRQVVASGNQSQSSNSGDPAGVRSLMREKPGLLLRLLPELQNGNLGWERVITGLPVAVLRALIDVFLSKNSRSGGSEQTNKMSELAVAIQNNAKKSKNRRFYYAQVLGCLSRGELIDFDAIGSAEAGVDAASKDAAIAYSSASVEIVKNEVDSTDFTRGMPAAGKFAPRELLLSAELLSAAAHTTGVALTAAQFDSLKWKFIDAYLTETGGLYNAGYFCRQYAETLLRQVGANDARQFRDAFIRALLQNSLPSTRDLARRLADLLADESEAFSDPDATAVPASAEPVDETAALETIYIANAGAVLLAPYLPLLFERLGLTEKGQFRNRDAAERGVHCLQFLVDESSSSPEFQLVLNKLLCGVRPGRPIRRSIELANDEKEQLEGLLRAIIENWRALGNTSVAGLRESFLQRNGRLQLENNAWRLSVEARPFDMLLDQLPWSFSAIKFAWMDRVIYTEWR